MGYFIILEVVTMKTQDGVLRLKEITWRQYILIRPPFKIGFSRDLWLHSRGITIKLKVPYISVIYQPGKLNGPATLLAFEDKWSIVVVCCHF